MYNLHIRYSDKRAKWVGRNASEHEKGRQTRNRGHPGGFAPALRDRGGVPANSRRQGRGHTPAPRPGGASLRELQPREKGGVSALERRKRRGLCPRRGGGSKVRTRPRHHPAPQALGTLGAPRAHASSLCGSPDLFGGERPLLPRLIAVMWVLG